MNWIKAKKKTIGLTGLLVLVLLSVTIMGHQRVKNFIVLGQATFNAGILYSDVIVTDAATYTVLPQNSGKIHVIGDLSQNTTINLPIEKDGLNYEFWYVGAAADAHDHNIDSEAAANFFIGGVSFLDTDAGDAADEVHLGVYSDGNSNSILTILNPAAGTIIKFTCDGTNWYIAGQVLSDTVPTLTDQA